MPRAFAACCFILSSLLAPSLVRTQTTAARPPVELGERVRLTRGQPDGGAVIGVLEARIRDSLIVRVTRDSTVRLAIGDVLEAARSEGRIDRQRALTRGVAWGAASGLALTLAITWRPLVGGDPQSRAFGELAFIIYGAVAVTTGSLIGAAAAASLGDERWSPRAAPLPGQPDAALPTGVPVAVQRAGAAIVPGTRVRVQFAYAAPDVVGDVTTIGDSLGIRHEDGRDVQIAWPSILALHRSLGRAPFVERAFLPTLLGATAGAVTMPRMVTAVGDGCGAAIPCLDGRTAVRSGVILGGAIGAFFGHRRHAERWEAVPVATPP